MPEQAMRPFTDAEGHTIAPSVAVPSGPLRSSLLQSQDTRRDVTSRGNANAALREVVEDDEEDPALDGILCSAFTASIQGNLQETGECFALTRTQASHAEALAQGEAAVPGSAAPPSQTGSTPVSADRAAQFSPQHPAIG